MQQLTALRGLTMVAMLAGLSACTRDASLVGPDSAASHHTSSTTSSYTNSRTLFVTSAAENSDGTVTLPLYRGTSGGHDVYYIVTDASESNTAARYGVNQSNKLAKAGGSAAVQKVTVVNGVINFPATVDFAPVRQVVAGPQGFPPAVAQPGAVGQPGYSPLIELPGGIIVNAPQIANATGQADKVVSIDLVAGTVRYRETNGFSNGKAVLYLSTDASDPAAAALENATFAPALNAVPTVGQDGTDQARASLAAFVNGQTGANNPQRQGLNSAILDGLDPLNVLRWTPNQGRYSPLWDVHPAAWTDAAIAGGRNLQQHSWDDIANLAWQGLVTGPGGAAFGPGGFIVNCPIISSAN